MYEDNEDNRETTNLACLKETVLLSDSPTTLQPIFFLCFCCSLDYFPLLCRWDILILLHDKIVITLCLMLNRRYLDLHQTE